MNKNGTRKQRAKRFLNQVHILGHNQYRVLNIENYVNAHKKLWIKHLKCGYKWKCEPTNFQYYPHCPKCDKYRGSYKSNKQFINELYKERDKKYIPQEKYCGARTAIWFKCNICDNSFKMTPDNILRGQNCPYCAEKSRANKRRTSTYTFKKRIRKNYGNKITLLSSLKNFHTKVKIRHNSKKCNFSIRWIAPTRINHKGYKCPYCTGQRFNTFTYAKRVYKLTHGICKLVSPYKAWHKRIKIRNLKYHFSKWIYPTKDPKKLLCPVFINKSSLGELKILTYLKRVLSASF